MKKFDSLTNQQKEYFYAWGTVASIAAVAIVIPPLAPIVLALAGVASLLVISVHLLDRQEKKTVKVEA